ncbi:hypothetical protein Tco_0170497, partial [Tanacetum coccineum]
FLSQKGGGGGRGVKEKQQSSANVAEKDTVVSSSAVDEPLDATVNTEDVKVGQTPNSPIVNPKPRTSYANLFTAAPTISAWFANTVYGFFLGKRVAYPVVANYVRNTWGKYRLVKSMLNSSTEIFSFQFSSMDGLDAMLENSPWFIRKNPLIRKKWNPNVNLLKEDVGNVSVWVKLHGVYVTAFSEDGLNAISTKLGTPLMLESYTSDMCMQS